MVRQTYSLFTSSPHSGDVQVNSCVAFRAVQLAMETEETALGLDWGTLKDYKMIVPGR